MTRAIRRFVQVGIVSFVLILGLPASPATAAGTLVADYQFQETHASSVGSPPDLTDIGAGNLFATETVDGAPTTVLTFPQDNGLEMSPATPTISGGVYSIVMLFRVADVEGYVRLVDFTDEENDEGLYILDGDLVFFDEDFGEGTPVAPDTYVQVVITRDASGIVTGYVDGVQHIQFTDTAPFAVVDEDNVLHFFRDDGGEMSAGAVARIRLYDDALSSEEVAGLDRLPSEPPPPPPPPAETSARIIDCGPPSTTAPTATTVTVTCAVTAREGGPLPGENVTFTSSGPGGVTSPSTVVSDGSGQASATVTSNDPGTQSVTGTLTDDLQGSEPEDVDECDRAAGDPPGAPQGVCTDSAIVMWEQEEPPPPVTCPGFEDDPRNQVVGTDAAETLVGTPADDIICGLDGDDTIDGGDGNDLILGGAGNDTMVGGAGADEIKGELGDDAGDGGAGFDVLRGGDGMDELGGGGDDDLVRGSRGDDELTGGSGRDTVRGMDGDDDLFGNSGDDQLYGGSGIDDGDGGPGTDSCTVETAAGCE